MAVLTFRHEQGQMRKESRGTCDYTCPIRRRGEMRDTSEQRMATHACENFSLSVLLPAFLYRWTSPRLSRTCHFCPEALPLPPSFPSFPWYCAGLDLPLPPLPRHLSQLHALLRNAGRQSSGNTGLACCTLGHCLYLTHPNPSPLTGP